MSLNDVLIIGALVASVIAGLLGFRRGDSLRASQNASTTQAPFALVGPTLADSQLMQQWIIAEGKQTEALEALTVQIKRIADYNDERKASKSDRIEELMARLAEKLDEAPPRRR